MFNGMNAAELSKHGYLQVDGATVRIGDVVMRTRIGMSGHAGLIAGWAAGGYPVGWADNGTPAYPDKVRQDKTTGPFVFNAISGYVTKFFRSQIP